MKKLEGRVAAVSAGEVEGLGTQPRAAIEVGFEGVAGDHHVGPFRRTYSGEREPKGSVVRNDRQWSAVSVEELAEISERLDLAEPLSPAMLSANLCVEGIPGFSLLPRGSRLKFPSGAALTVEEYNAPCRHMGARIAAHCRTNSGKPLGDGEWLKPAAGRRGLVGVVDVPGEIRAGDDFTVEVYEPPVIRRF